MLQHTGLFPPFGKRGAMTKEERYAQLIERVKSTYPVHVDGMTDPEGRQLYWCEACREINLWTYWQGRGRLSPKILLVGQDWGSPWDDPIMMRKIVAMNRGEAASYMEGNESKTDKNLVELFECIGCDITVPHPELFFTNFVLGYRHHGTSGGFQRRWADHDSDFFRELADILQPQVILCLGRDTTQAVMEALGGKFRCPKGYNAFLDSQANPMAAHLPGGAAVQVFALAHCGVYGTMNRSPVKSSRDLSLQVEDWVRIKPWLRP